MKTVTTSVGFQDPLGNLVASGKLILDLSQPAEITSGGGLLAPIRIVLPLTALAKITPTNMWFNDELTPTGTSYHSILIDSNQNEIADFGQWVIAGASADLSTMVPTSGGASAAGAVLLNPVAQQNINGQTLNLEGAALSFSAAASTTADAFVNRGGAGVVNIGTSTSNASGTVNAAAYEVSGVGMTGSGGLVRATSATLTTPTLVSPTISNPTISGTATFTGTVDAAAFTLSGTAMNGSAGGVVRATSPTITTGTLASPTISGTASFLGQTVTAFRVQAFTGLTSQAPTATEGQEWVLTVTLSSPFADATFFVLAQIQGASAGTPVVIAGLPASASTVDITFANASAVQSTVTAVLVWAIHL